MLTVGVSIPPRCRLPAYREIELHRETPGIYFHMYRSAWDFWPGEFRYRGVVYAPGSPIVIHDRDDTEERVDVGEGWYTFLIIDI
jgi:hypothetical protein